MEIANGSYLAPYVVQQINFVNFAQRLPNSESADEKLVVFDRLPHVKNLLEFCHAEGDQGDTLVL